MNNTLRTIAGAVLSRALPLALPAGMMMAEVGLMALRTEVDQLTTERDQLELECEQRRAYLAGGPDYMDDVDDVDLVDDPAMRPLPVNDPRGDDFPGRYSDVLAGGFFAAAARSDAARFAAGPVHDGTPDLPLNYQHSDQPPLAVDYLREGWTYDGDGGWHPPAEPGVDLNLPPIATVDPDPEARFAAALTEPPLSWRETDSESTPRVCVDDGAEVLTVFNDVNRTAPGILICTKCERTVTEPPELVAERVEQLAAAPPAPLPDQDNE